MRLPVFFPLSLLLFPGRQLWKAGSLTRRPSKEKKKKTTATNYWQQQRTFAQLSAAYSRVIIGRQTAMASRRKSQRERGNPPVVSWDVQTPERQSRGNLSCFIHAIDGWMDAWPSVAYAQHNKGPSPIHSEWRMRIGSSQSQWENGFRQYYFSCRVQFSVRVACGSGGEKNRHEFGLRVREKVDPVRWPALNLVG